MLRWKDVLEMVNMSKFAVANAMKDGTFPPNKKIGKRAVGWRKSDIEAWMDGKREWES